MHAKSTSCLEKAHNKYLWVDGFTFQDFRAICFSELTHTKCWPYADRVGCAGQGCGCSQYRAVWVPHLGRHPVWRMVDSEIRLGLALSPPTISFPSGARMDAGSRKQSGSIWTKEEVRGHGRGGPKLGCWTQIQDFGRDYINSAVGKKRREACPGK